MAFSYGEPTYTIPISPFHTHGAFPYSFWGGTSVGRPGPGYGMGPGMMGGMGMMGRGFFGFPPSAMLRGTIPMRYTRFRHDKTSSVKNLQIFPVLRTFMQAARDYEALDINNLVKKGKRQYELKKIPALKGSLKGFLHYAMDPAITVADSVKTRRNEIAVETGKMSESGFKFAKLDQKTKNLKRGFKWGLEGQGYASHLVEKLTSLNSCFNAEELDREAYDATVSKIVSDLKDFYDMRAISEKEFKETLEKIREQVIPNRSLSM